jgi:hypothetical protein
MQQNRVFGQNSGYGNFPQGVFNSPGGGMLNQNMNPQQGFNNPQQLPHPSRNQSLNNPKRQPFQAQNQNQFQQNNYNQNQRPQTNYNQNYQQNPFLDEHSKMEAQNQEEAQQERYYTNILGIGIAAILCYFMGAFLLIFVNNVGGETIVNLPTYNVSWQLLFSNPFEYFRNIFLSVFGYFFQYARLYGFFPDLGELNQEAFPKYLMPVDIVIKLTAVLYFNFGWMPWDTKRFFNRGALNKKYPFLNASEKSQKQTKPQIQESAIPSINIPANVLEQRVQNQPNPQNANYQNNYNYYQNQNYNQNNDENDDGEDEGLIPFSGVQKPLEEWYYKNEQFIYTFIRKRILPGSNLLLALYFSTLGVLDISRNPVEVLLYILGIMSMFWCMQTFLLILDHVHYPPEEDFMKEI